MALRKKAMAIVLSMAMVATSLSLPNMTAKTAQAAGSSFQNLNQSQITEASGTISVTRWRLQVQEHQMKPLMVIQSLRRILC